MRLVENIALENLRDKAHAFEVAKLFAVGRDDPGAFLAAMLQRVEAIIRELGRVGMAKNAEHTAIMFGIILLLLLHKRSAQASVSVTPVTCRFKQLCKIFIHRNDGKNL